MIDMDVYYKNFIDYNIEMKLNKKLRRDIFSIFAFLLLELVAITFLVMSIIYFISNNFKNNNIYIILAGTLSIIGIFILIITDSMDPLKKYNLNDKIFISLIFTIKFINTKDKSIIFSKQMNHMKINYLLNRLSGYFYILEQNMNNSFIFTTFDFNINAVKLTRNLFSSKLKILLKNNKIEEVNELFKLMINAYSYIIEYNLTEKDSKINYSLLSNRNKLKISPKSIKQRNFQLNSLNFNINNMKYIENIKRGKNVSYKKVRDKLESLKNLRLSDTSTRGISILKIKDLIYNRTAQIVGILLLSIVLIYFTLTNNKMIIIIPAIATIIGLSVTLIQSTNSKK